MEKKYELKVNGKYQFELDESDIEIMDMVKTGPNSIHLLKNHQTYDVNLVSSDFNGKSYKVSLNNTDYEVIIADPLDVLINQMGFEVGASAKVSNIEAPMPGLILEVSITEGQEVQEGEALVILEAMKMENTITSPRTGIIKHITVEKGQAVEKKQLLITFE